MFTTGHFIFIAISAVLILSGLLFCLKKRPPLRTVLKVCMALALLSEVMKILTAIQIVPVTEPVVENGILVYRETGAFTPYLESEHLPFELCSYQIFFIFLALVLKNRKFLRILHATMFATCIIGGLLAIFLSSETIGRSTVQDFIGSSSVWRQFIYHSVLVVLGVYIGVSDEADLHFRDIRYSMISVAILYFISMYLNSMMATPYYSGDTLVGVGNVINYFSSYNNPLGIVMRDKTAWYIYLLICVAGFALLTLLVNLPLLIKDRKGVKADVKE